MAIFKKLKTTYSASDSPIAVVQLQNFNPNNIVKKLDYSNLIQENSTSYNSIVALEPDSDGGVTFPLKKYINHDYHNIDFYITEKVNSNNNPLFFTYELKFDTKNIIESDVIQIFKNNKELVPASEYKVEFADRLLFDNYINYSNDSNYTRYGSSLTWSSFNIDNTVHRARVLLPLSLFNKKDFYTIRYNKHYMNVQFPNHSELIELERLYSTDDYTVVNGEIDVSASNINTDNLNALYVTRNPYAQINAVDVYNVTTDGEMSAANSSWNIKINTGSFVRSSAKFDESTEFYEVSFEDTAAVLTQPLSYIKPEYITTNVYQLPESPLHITGYEYPNYDIPIFPNTTNTNDLVDGSIGINIGSELLNNITIASIDRHKGFLQLNKEFDQTIDILFFVYINLDQSMYIQNLELNPRVESEYGLSSLCTNTFKDVGIAVRKNINSIGVGDWIDYRTPYFFDFNDPTTFYRGDYTSSSTVVSVAGALNWNPYTSVVDTDAEFLPIAMLNLNELSPEVLKITDARVINGGVDDKYTEHLKNNENNSFVDIGYYDGELLPHESLKIVHIPRHIYTDLIERWKNSGQFSKEMYTDITEYEAETLRDANPTGVFVEYYNGLLNGESGGGVKFKSSYTKMLNEWAEREASYYLDRVIKKYISAGMEYILMDENFKFINLRLGR